MKSFLFITPRTPLNLQTPLRKKLFDVYLNALYGQTYANWKALIIGEEEGEEENIIYLKTNEPTKNSKINLAIDYIRNLEKKPDFIVRLDDDDIIAPDTLEIASTLNFDCYADSFHNFFDIVKLKFSQQKRNWLPNTVIHKYEYAMHTIPGEQGPLINLEHTRWLSYYKDKLLVFSEKESPVYIRVISPTAITSNQVPAGKTDWEKYYFHLKSFGHWKNCNYKQFESLFSQLKGVNEMLGEIPSEKDGFLRKIRHIFE